MGTNDIKDFEARLEAMRNPRERRAFLHSLYSDLMGYNHSDDIKTTTANSPHLLKAHDVSLKEERNFIEYGAGTLRKFGFTSHADKLVNSYNNSHFPVDSSEGYTAENRTRVLDRLMGLSERVVLFPNDIGNVVQLELHKDGHVGFCVSDEPMTRDQAMEKYSLENFPMGISGVGFGISAAQTLLDGTATHTFYTSIEDKASFRKAVDLAYRKVA